MMKAGCHILLLALAGVTGFAQTNPQRPETVVVTLPQAVVGEAYYQQLRPSTQGKAPWKWKLISGKLPGDVALRADGLMAGTANQSGLYRVRLEASDSSNPPVVVQVEATLVVRPPLEADWKQPPFVQGDGNQGSISGSLIVTNSTAGPIDLTVIVLAVSENGRATALGYQHFSLSPGTQVIPFGSALPRGRYVVHADVVGEIARTRTILRASQERSAITVP
jgi:hypothetical protein